ncbi:MAG: DNA polymerase IV [Patescibacteria group bacterium]|nr:DNA polymerase IV [Patescibacteria group bacterium]MDE2172575.1 DNA polymerase IV [Patescibacteria group bacterium]
MKLISHRSFPRAILHVDGDSFFVACEVARDPSLRGKPVVTGKERGIASALSYEAKALGATRAMRISRIRALIPDVIVLPSDYETYSLYSERMYGIVRRYTEAIEEYSIDECFADLTGMRRPNAMSYEDMAARIKRDLDNELGITFSVGLSLNKVCAKIASKWHKPSGLTVIRGKELHAYLECTPIEKVWGIGPNTSAYLHTLGITTAYEFACKDQIWVRTHVSKPFQEIHAELNGSYVYPLILGRKRQYASISKTKTFTPPSRDREFIFSQLSKNAENACIKLRRHGLFAKSFAFFLKTQEFNYYGLDVKLAQAVSAPQEIVSHMRRNFEAVFRRGRQYRATGVVLMDLRHSDAGTMNLFDASGKADTLKMILGAVDLIDHKFGKHTVFLGSSLAAMTAPAHYGDRAEASRRRTHLLKGENGRQRLGIPIIGSVS